MTDENDFIVTGPLGTATVRTSAPDNGFVLVKVHLIRLDGTRRPIVSRACPAVMVPELRAMAILTAREAVGLV